MEDEMNSYSKPQKGKCVNLRESGHRKQEAGDKKDWITLRTTIMLVSSFSTTHFKPILRYFSLFVHCLWSSGTSGRYLETFQRAGHVQAQV